MLVVTRWVLARLRHQRFFSLNELNRSLRGLLLDLNQRPFKKLPGCRASAFAEMDLPALLHALPELRYEYAELKVARVGVDYHVEVDGHYYSVLYQHARAEVDVRVTKATVELFQRGQRIAFLPRPRQWIPVLLLLPVLRLLEPRRWISKRG